MKILVTGGTGYIGSHTTVELIQKNYDLEIIDNLYNSKIEVLDKIQKITGLRPKFHHVDLMDLEKLREIFKNGNFDAIIHFAGLKAVAESIEKPSLYYEKNIGTTLNLLKCMKEFNVKNIIFSSSATVYGTQKTAKLDESMLTGIGITNPYGETKYIIERLLNYEANVDPDFSVVTLRYFNPVGAHPSGLLGEDPNGIPNNLMPIIMKVSKGEIAKLSVYGDDYPTPDGTCMRDYIHVVDLAKGHLAAIKALQSPGVKIYNLGTGRGTSVLEMVKAFENAGGEPLPHQITDRRPGDLAEIYADPSKAQAELNWQTELTIADAMKDTINFLKNQN